MAATLEEQENITEGQYVESDNVVMSNQASPAVKCIYCDAHMFQDEIPRFSRVLGIVILIMGVLLSLSIWFFGLPMVIIGAYMSVASKPVWTCKGCGVVVDRYGS